MGVPSFAASNSIIYLTYGAFLVVGLLIAWKLRHQSKTEFLSSNRTQKGPSHKLAVSSASRDTPFRMRYSL
ncbi:hypothetical protein W97_06793 [Coniosporium apollinis CBS 100218]|uniref:Uncharacterized protein n=1 Tax=Coniosporium apollinis (strain CBS 100218) TaxID=1168221 RepID=R7Z0D6_CONA1|nr:uncharacterized protein W97_06793 [Coniosporium apollinis CBS 100218]EON67650.1 hypothetical protein W97_06793 [Coniosporium apollinis CBS 100218]